MGAASLTAFTLVAATGLSQTPQPTPGSVDQTGHSQPALSPTDTTRPPASEQTKTSKITSISDESQSDRKAKEDDEKEKKDTKAPTNVAVGITSALAWPVAFFFAILLVFFGLIWSKTFRALFGITLSSVRKIEIPGLKMEVDPSKIGEFKDAAKESFDELVKKAEPNYREMVSALLLSAHLSRMIRNAMPEILRNRNLPQDPEGLRATVYVPDIVVSDYLYQLVPYFPRPGAGGNVARRFSQRYGIIGRAWRLQRSIGQGQAVGGPTAATQLIEVWGMTADEAANANHLRPANLCVMLRDPEAADVPIGLVYIDSTRADAFSPTADDVAEEVEAHPLTIALGTAVASAMRALRVGPPSLEISSS